MEREQKKVAKKTPTTTAVNNPLLRFQHNILDQIGSWANRNELSFDESDKNRAVNALRTIEPMLLEKGLDWNYFNDPLLRNNITSVLQQVMFLKVNPSVVPRECYFIWRNTKVGTTKNKYGKEEDVKKLFLEFGIEGAGNDTILREFGVNVKQVKSYMVYEGDQFTGVSFDGFEEIPPKFTPKMRKLGESKGKALYAVYLIQKTDGRIETAIAEREDVKQSLLAHIRQNIMYYHNAEELLSNLNEYSLDDILNNNLPTTTFELARPQGNRKVEISDLISPAWKSVVSREKMIERKMRNHAIRRYPKNFSHKVVEELYEATFEERYDGSGNLIVENQKDFIADYQETAEQEANTVDIPKGVAVDQDTTPQKDDIKEKDFKIIQEEDVVVDETTEQESDYNVDEDDDPFGLKETKEKRYYDDLIDDPVDVEEADSETTETEMPDWML